MRRALVLAAVMVLSACSASGLSGRYLTSPGSDYGFEFDGDTVYSLVGGDTARGDYTVDGSSVRICIWIGCTDLRLIGDCLIGEDGGRYCKD